MIEYSSTRLCFKADVIEPLGTNDSFMVHTPKGTFMFTKADFYRVFSNVVKTESYQKAGWYSYSSLPKKAMPFLISASVTDNVPVVADSPKDLVGDEIREKIKEIGMLWRQSENNPTVDEEVLKKWEQMIEDWVVDKNMPLIVRKETHKKGQSFIHPSGREIIIADNSFAIWVFSRVLKGEVFTLARMKELLQQNQLPMMFVSAKKYAEAKYSKTLGTNPLADWKLCHIERVGFNTKKSIYDLDISAIQDHFRKYANPNNMFVLPKEIGALGEIESFICVQKIRSDILKKH